MRACKLCMGEIKGRRFNSLYCKTCKAGIIKEQNKRWYNKRRKLPENWKKELMRKRELTRAKKLSKRIPCKLCGKTLDIYRRKYCKECEKKAYEQLTKRWVENHEERHREWAQKRYKEYFKKNKSRIKLYGYEYRMSRRLELKYQLPIKQIIPLIEGGCIKCGFKEAIEIHHKDFNNKNNEISNLECLCINHHSIVHHRNRNAIKIMEYANQKKMKDKDLK